MQKTFYWHDYETWGANPAVDRPSQFAGVRTDMDLNIIGEPLVIYCKPPEDIWPNPEACLVTGLTPQETLAKGVTEREFIKQIHRELAKPGTCGVGYNSIRFDDEVTRYTLYRNYFDPYEREWRNGNSRWDIIDMVRLCYALRPEGIEWPVVDGKPSFKLENLTKANGIVHASAHDAYSDVEATIKLARLIREKQPALYEHVVNNRGKREATKLLDVASKKPMLHISSKFSSENGCAGLIAPLAYHPVNKNAVIVINLNADPKPLFDLSADEIRARIFTATKDLPEGVERLPVKLIHLNKCPILLTPKILDEQAQARLGIDKAQCEKHWSQLQRMDITEKLQQVFATNDFEGSLDPERMLYDGFVGDTDKYVMADVRKANGAELSKHNFVFSDKRLNDMLLRYKARNFPDDLTDSERAEWREFVSLRLKDGGDGVLSLSELNDKLVNIRAELEQQQDQDQSKEQIAKKLDIIKALEQYVSKQSQLIIS